MTPGVAKDVGFVSFWHFEQTIFAFDERREGIIVRNKRCKMMRLPLSVGQSVRAEEAITTRPKGQGSWLGAVWILETVTSKVMSASHVSIITAFFHCLDTQNDLQLVNINYLYLRTRTFSDAASFPFHQVVRPNPSKRLSCLNLRGG